MDLGPRDGHVPPARVGRDHPLDVGTHRPRREDDRVGDGETDAGAGPMMPPQIGGPLRRRAIHIEHPHLRIDQELLRGRAGLAVAGIFQLRNVMENRHGKTATKQPRFAGFEAEDVLYLIPIVTLAGALDGFLRAAAVGAPLALLIVAVQYVLVERRHQPT